MQSFAQMLQTTPFPVLTLRERPFSLSCYLLGGTRKGYPLENLRFFTISSHFSVVDNPCQIVEIFVHDREDEAVLIRKQARALHDPGCFVGISSTYTPETPRVRAKQPGKTSQAGLLRLSDGIPSSHEPDVELRKHQPKEIPIEQLGKPVSEHFPLTFEAESYDVTLHSWGAEPYPAWCTLESARIYVVMSLLGFQRAQIVTLLLHLISVNERPELVAQLDQEYREQQARIRRHLP